MKKIIAFLVLISLTASGFGLSFDFEKQEEAAIVQLSGTISSQSSGSVFSSSGITPGEVRSINERVEENGYDAVLYEINSGGGTVVASKEIMREIESMEMPTVCRFRDVAASGAYLFALGCDRIVADSASLTGSIGVKSSFLEFSEAMDEHGVEYINISSGKYKEIGSSYMNTSVTEKSILKNKSEKIHQQFLHLVENNRNVSESQIEEVRTGEIFIGSEAENLGLVDVLGGRETAKNLTEEIAGEEMRFSELGREQQFSILSLFSMNGVLENFLVDSGVPIKAAL